MVAGLQLSLIHISSYLSGTIGIWPDILNTLYIVLATILIVVPLGVGAAIYPVSYTHLL